MKTKSWYAKQYWKLWTQILDMEYGISYAMQADGIEPEDWQIEQLDKLKRLKVFAKSKACDVACMRPHNLGVYSIFDLGFPA